MPCSSSDIDDVVAGYITCHLARGGSRQHRAGGHRGGSAPTRLWTRSRRDGAGVVRRERRHLRVSVVTQGATQQALSFYQRAGFEVTSIELWFHRVVHDGRVARDRLARPVQPADA